MNPPPLPPSLPPPLPPRKSQAPAILRLLLLMVAGCLLVGYLNFGLIRQSAVNILRAYVQPRSSRLANGTVPDHAHQGDDAVQREIMAYRSGTRLAYNARRFDELERLAADARATSAKFGNGGWKIVQFYTCLACRDTEPEGMWQLHDQIHQAWIAAKPQSITARVARIDFLVDYAWRARGSGYADTITPEGGRRVAERLHQAHEALDEAKGLADAAPEWWSAGMYIALGEGWSRATYDKFYAEAKTRYPLFWGYDTLRSNYLATKWYGEPGDWEKAATEAAADPRSLGDEIYARCVLVQSGNYRNIFRQSAAVWGKTRDGFEQMRTRYPDSVDVTSDYCRFACLAEDRPTAKRLFDLLGDNAFSDDWGSVANLRRDRAWANQAP